MNRKPKWKKKHPVVAIIFTGLIVTGGLALSSLLFYLLWGVLVAHSNTVVLTYWQILVAHLWVIALYLIYKGISNC